MRNFRQINLPCNAHRVATTGNPSGATGAAICANFLKLVAILTVIGGVIAAGLFWGETETWEWTEDNAAFRLGYVAGVISASLLSAALLGGLAFALDVFVDQARTVRRVEDAIDELLDDRRR